MVKKIIWTVVVLVLLVAVIFGLKAMQNYYNAIAQAKLQPLPTPVDHVLSTSETWNPYIESIGTLYALNGTDIKVQTDGRIETVNFHTGDMVKAGQVLVTLDSKPLLASIAQNQAQLDLAKIQLKRQQALLAQAAASQSDVDIALAAVKTDQAIVDGLNAQLAYKTIVAPFEGKLGLKKISVGQYLAIGDVVANIQSVDPIHVTYPIADKDVSSVKLGLPVTVTTDQFPNQIFNGKIIALNSQLDVESKSLSVSAELPNKDPQHLLLPGAFVVVHTILPTQQNIVTIPETALVHTLYSDSVYTISAQAPYYVLKQEYVTVGKTINAVVQILSGLKAGVEIVNNGQYTLHDGSVVRLATGS